MKKFLPKSLATESANKERPRSNYQSGFKLNPVKLRLQKGVAFIEQTILRLGIGLIVGAL
jgi:hypothetical protein